MVSFTFYLKLLNSKHIYMHIEYSEKNIVFMCSHASWIWFL